MADNKRKKINSILQAASSCFADRGLKRTTYACLAEESGVPVEEIKALYRNKNMIAFELQTRGLEKAKMEYLAKMPDATCYETIKFILRSRLEFAEKNADRTIVFFSKGLLGRQPWSSMLDQMIWQLSVELVAIVEKDIREGRIRKGTNATIAVRSIVSFYLTGFVTNGLRSKNFKADEVWNFIEPQLEIFLSALKTD